LQYSVLRQSVSSVQPAHASLVTLQLGGLMHACVCTAGHEDELPVQFAESVVRAAVQVWARQTKLLGW
jgi:hypothetical protein